MIAYSNAMTMARTRNLLADLPRRAKDSFQSAPLGSLGRSARKEISALMSVSERTVLESLPVLMAGFWQIGRSREYAWRKKQTGCGIRRSARE
jgi:hypothetical protein